MQHTTSDRPPDDRGYLAALERTTKILRLIEQRHSPAVLATAFGPESMVMTDLIHRLDLGIEIVSIDTGRLPSETHELAQRVHLKYGPLVRILAPEPTEVAAWVAQHGSNGFYENMATRQACCEIRKVAPLRRILQGKSAWLSGLRREHSAGRTDVAESGFDTAYGVMKFNPLVNWTGGQVWAYIHDHEVPYNALHDQGYPSIGCAPCTRAVEPGEDMRAGRWWWEHEGDRECGLHIDPATGRLQRANHQVDGAPR